MDGCVKVGDLPTGMGPVLGKMFIIELLVSYHLLQQVVLQFMIVLR